MKRFAYGMFVVSALEIALAQPVFSKPNDKDCWLLTQTNPNSPYSHSQLVLIAPQAVNISADDVKMFMVAPDYKVSIYNTTSHEYYQAPAKEWMKKYGAHPFSQTGKYITKGISGKVGSIPANQYFMMHGEKEKAQKQREIWTTEAIDTNPNVKEALRHMCGLPEGSVTGVPLRVVRLIGRDHKEVLLNTSAVKRIPAPKNAFLEPTGYKKVKSEVQLMMNYGKNSDLKDLLEGAAGK